VSTVAVSHNLDPFLSLLKRDGTLVLVGRAEQPHPSPTGLLPDPRPSLPSPAPRLAGSPKPRKCSTTVPEKNIVSDIEMIRCKRLTKRMNG